METLPALPAAVLPDFLAQLQRICPTTLQGLYLTGSLALGDYHARKSDIDFLVLVSEQLEATQLAQVAALHQALEKKYDRPNLSGYYVTLAGLRGESPRFPSFFGSRLHPSRPFELPTFFLFEWQTTALTLCGPPARDLFSPPPAAEVLAELHQNLNDYWRRWIANHTFPMPGYWQLVLFPRLTEWGVLGVVRQLYTLDTHRVASKQAAGHYYLTLLPSEHQAVIRTALATRITTQTHWRPSRARARQTLACMACVLATFNRRYADWGTALPAPTSKPHE